MVFSLRVSIAVLAALLGGTGIANADPIATEEPEPVYLGIGMGQVPQSTTVSAGNWRLLLGYL